MVTIREKRRRRSDAAATGDYATQRAETALAAATALYLNGVRCGVGVGSVVASRCAAGYQPPVFLETDVWFLLKAIEQGVELAAAR